MPKVKKEDNVLYAGADEWVNTRTGQVITANQIIKKWIYDYISIINN